MKTFSHLTIQRGRILKLNSPFARFLLVGLLNTIVGLTIMFLLKKGLRWPYWLATFTGNSLGATVSFMMNRSFTFDNSTSVKEGGPRFLVVILLCYFFSYSISRFISGVLESLEWLPGIIGTDNLAILLGSGIYTISNYFGQKKFVFK